MKKEEWRDIAGYEGLYQVSNLGNVKSLGNGKARNPNWCKEHILKNQLTRYGYLKVPLSKNGKVKNYLVHRLVGKVFIPNPDNLPQVNHKDECKTNNCVDNLEWCTPKYNLNYGTCQQRAHEKQLNDPKQSIKIKCLDLETNVTTTYLSMRETMRQLNIPLSSLSHCLYDNKKPYKNRYIFSEINKEK